MTLPETADRLDVSLRTVFRYLSAGRLEGVRGARSGGPERVPGARPRRVFVRQGDADRLLTERYGRRLPRNQDG